MWAPLATFHAFRVDDLSKYDFRLVRCSTNSCQVEIGEGVIQNTLPGMQTHHKRETARKAAVTTLGQRTKRGDVCVLLAIATGALFGVMAASGWRCPRTPTMATAVQAGSHTDIFRGWIGAGEWHGS